MSHILKSTKKVKDNKIIPSPINSYKNNKSNRPFLDLQNNLGNQVVLKQIQVGKSNDFYEQEANSLAEQITKIPDSKIKKQQKEHINGKSIAQQITPINHRKNEVENESTYSTKLPYKTQQVASNMIMNEPFGCNGQPLSQSERDFFEPRFCYDFSQVRIYKDGRITQLANNLNVQAFTFGRNIVFKSGKYVPESVTGKKILAHELTHIVQQSKSHRNLQNFIQCWGPFGHRELTKQGIGLIFGYDKETKDFLYKHLPSKSNDIDFRPEEEYFNLGGLLIVNGSIIGTALTGIKFPVRKQEIIWLADYNDTPKEIMQYLKRLPDRFYVNRADVRQEIEKLGGNLILKDRLRDYYRKNEDRARNHGEGGLYSMQKPTAKFINEAHQKQYEDLFVYEKDLDKKICALGNALHVTQDRGAHGEGAINEGHERQIDTHKDPDNERDNGPGWGQAEQNTKDLLKRNKIALEQLSEFQKAKSD